MKRLITTVTVLLAIVATVAVSGSFAANPEPQKLEFSGTFTDPDFCGTGVRGRGDPPDPDRAGLGDGRPVARRHDRRDARAAPA